MSALVLLAGSFYLTNSANEWVSFTNGKQYWFDPQCKASRDEADAACKLIDSDAQLAIVSSQSVRDFITNVVFTGEASIDITTEETGPDSRTVCTQFCQPYVFTGGNLNFALQSISFADESTTFFDSVSWQASEPDGTQTEEYCFGFENISKLWNSVVCNSVNAYVCERENPDQSPCRFVEEANKCGVLGVPCLHENYIHGDFTCYPKTPNSYGIISCRAGSFFCSNVENPTGCGFRDCPDGTCVYDIGNECANTYPPDNLCYPGTTLCEV